MSSMIQLVIFLQFNIHYIKWFINKKNIHTGHFLILFSGDCKNSFVVAKDNAPIVDITWPPSHPRAIYSSLTVSGEILEKLRPFIESGKLKAQIDPTGPYKFKDVIEAFRYLETGRARGKVVISAFPYTESTWCHFIREQEETCS